MLILPLEYKCKVKLGENLVTINDYLHLIFGLVNLGLAKV